MSSRPDNGTPVVLAHLYAAIDAALASVQVDLEKLGAEQKQMSRQLAAIAKRLDARPVRGYLLRRTTSVLDHVLPLALVAAITFLIAR